VPGERRKALLSGMGGLSLGGRKEMEFDVKALSIHEAHLHCVWSSLRVVLYNNA